MRAKIVEICDNTNTNIPYASAPVACVALRGCGKLAHSCAKERNQALWQFFLTMCLVLWVSLFLALLYY